MPLTNEDIISGLVAYYKRTGVDMTALLGDPTFQSLKMVEKIQAIKDYAKDIHDGSSDNLTGSEKKSIAINATLRGLFPIATAVGAIGIHNFKPRLIPGVHSKTLVMAGLLGVGAGAAFGGLQGYLQARQNQNYKKTLRANLANVIADPSTTNAVGVLATDNIARQNQGAATVLTNRAIDELNKYDTTRKTVDLYNEFLPAFQQEAAAEQGRRYRNPNVKVKL